MFKFTKTIQDLLAASETIQKRTFALEAALDEAKQDLNQTKKDLTEALDLIGRFMDQTVLVAKDVAELATTKPKTRPKK